MSRPGITYHDVADVAQQLIAQGKNPTIESIRALTGTGSSTTIANHLKVWKNKQEDRRFLCAKENLPEEIVLTMKGLWERVITQAEEQVMVIEQGFNQTLIELKTHNQTLQEDNHHWQQQHQHLKREKEGLVSDKLALEQIVRHLEDEKITTQGVQEKLAQQLHDKQDRIDELSRLSQQAQANLEHYRETSREQRITEQHHHENVQSQLEQTIQQLGQELIATKQEKATFEKHSHQAMLENDVLKMQQIKLEIQSELLMTRLTEALNELAKKTQEQSDCQNQLQTLQAKQEEQAQSLIELKTQNGILLKQTETMNTDCHHLREQNQLLSHEKWTLGQEKAQLMGQLVQFEKRRESL